MRLEKRIRALEARLIADPLVLCFADGSTRELGGRGDFVMGLFHKACGGVDISPGQAAKLDLIRKSVSAQEPGGAHMVELLRCLLNGPVEE
jgi:hypothetical protein